MSAAIQSAANAIASLDASPFNAKLETSRAGIATLQAAIDKAISRQQEIQRTIADMRSEGFIGDKAGFDIAEALLAGDVDVAKRPDTAALDDELAMLAEGVRELRRRIDGERQAISATLSAMKAAVGAECIMVATELEAKAVELADQLVSIYAASAALVSVAPNNPLSNLRRKLAPAITGLCADNSRLDPRGGDIAVPPMINLIVEAIRAFEPTLANAVPSSVGIPRD